MLIKYEKLKTQDYNTIINLIKKLYKEDGNTKISTRKIKQTFSILSKYPDKGKIIVIKSNNQIIGYSILINFYSNEYGGDILNIDELYIEKQFRNKKIGTKFINFLKTQKINGLQLEVNSKNKKALKLYKRLGFSENKNKNLYLELF